MASIDVSSRFTASQFEADPTGKTLVRIVEDETNAHALVQVNVTGSGLWSTIATLAGIHGGNSVDVTFGHEGTKAATLSDGTDFSSSFTVKNTTLASSYGALYVGIEWSADLNGDGYGDLIVAGASYPPSGNVPQPGRALFGDGAGNFAVVPTSTFPWDTLQTVHPREVVSADFNGDGRPDIFIASHGYDTSPFPGEQNRLYLSAPNGTWVDATSSLPQIVDFSHSAATGDVNGDGFIDVYVGNVYGQQQVPPYFLINDGTGHFTRNDNLLPIGPGQLMNLNVSKYTSSLLYDLDGDGKLDLILGNEGDLPQNQSRILWNTGSGFDQNHVTVLPSGVFPNSNHTVIDVQAVDVNRDGHADLITLSTQNNPFYVGWSVDIYLNDGNHSFSLDSSAMAPADASNASSGTGWGRFIVPMDVNNDGAMDFIVSDHSGSGAALGTPFIYVNDGTGHFTTITEGEITGNSPALAYDTIPFVTASGVSFGHPYISNGTLFITEAVAKQPLPATAGPLQAVTGSFAVLANDGHFGDFDGDHKADLVWRNDNGAVATWQMNGATVLATHVLPGVSNDWHIVGIGDFDGDHHADILWWNDDGTQLEWQMTNSGGIAATPTIGQDFNHDVVAGLGDTDGDGKTDIILRDPQGIIYIWKMNGAQVSSVGVNYSVGNDWSVVGVGDYNGDGKADVMFRNESQGVNAAWLMNGANVSSTVFYPGVPNDWHVVGTGDFNGDGIADLFWHNDAGGNAVWLMNSSGGVAQAAFFSGVSSDWHVVGTGDFDGDHKDDVIWHNDSGATAVWTMNGASTPSVSFPGGAPIDWTSQVHHYEYV